MDPTPDDLCDTCGGVLKWSEVEGWRHIDASHPHGIFRAEDPADHEPTARRSWEEWIND